MTEKYYIWDKADGVFLAKEFETAESAAEEIELFNDEDAYLMQVIKMHPTEFLGRYAMCYLYSNKYVERLEKAIQEDLFDKTPFWYYEQIGMCLSCQEWIGEKYASHFKEALLNEGGGVYEDYEGDGNDTRLKSFKEYLDKLRMDIDYAEDYDTAFAKYNNIGASK